MAPNSFSSRTALSSAVLGNFYAVNLQTGQERQLTDLKTSVQIRTFDVMPDGKQIVFDRLRQNSDIAVIDLPR